MVQVLGTTYQVLRVRGSSYRIVRIHDEAVAGSFSCGQTLEIAPGAVDLALMRQLAAAAIRGGKTGWMGRAAA
ncbi:MAG TPA: hypothetical protein VEQ58_11075 [Polyangiaceae bacterium]|nr:hypothetical protein [Polyangiaceae bacterium]